MSQLFDRAQILELLRALAAELDAAGVQGDLFLVGGAAMALAYDTRRATRDLDIQAKVQFLLEEMFPATV